jgi:hypothetical protein
MGGYRIRLGDGSEIGPMDLAAMRTWIAQGAVDEDSLVMRPGTRKWVPLGTIPEFRGTVGRTPTQMLGRSRRGAVAVDSDEPERSSVPRRFDRWPHVLAALLLLVTAAVFGGLAWKPDQVVPVFDGAPWLELALGALALALALLPGWSLMRRLVRIVLLLASFALFPLVGILLAQGQRGLALLALAGAWLFALGLWALLAPAARLASTALALLFVLGGAAAAVRYGYTPEGEAASSVRAWTSPDRTFTDESAGLRIDLPPGWFTLRPGNPVSDAPENARLALAHPRQGGFAWLITQAAPKGVGTAEAYLELLIAQRTKERPEYEAAPSLGRQAGAIPVRRASASWQNGEVRERELVVAGLDGWMAFALVAWMPEAAANRSNALESLANALTARGVFESRLRQSVDAAVAAVPHLTTAAAQQLMARSEARVLDPEQAFHRSLAALAKLLPTLSKPESAELGRLTAATYAGVPWAERRRMASYIERLRRDEPTSVEEDRAMAQLFQGAERRLTPTQLVRLQAYYDKAVLD